MPRIDAMSALDDRSCLIVSQAQKLENEKNFWEEMRNFGLLQKDKKAESHDFSLGQLNKHSAEISVSPVEDIEDNFIHNFIRTKRGVYFLTYHYLCSSLCNLSLLLAGKGGGGSPQGGGLRKPFR